MSTEAEVPSPQMVESVEPIASPSVSHVELGDLLHAYVRLLGSMHMLRCAAWHQLEEVETERIRMSLEAADKNSGELVQQTSIRSSSGSTSMPVLSLLGGGSRARPNGGFSLATTLSDVSKSAHAKRKAKVKVLPATASGDKVTLGHWTSPLPANA